MESWRSLMNLRKISPALALLLLSDIGIARPLPEDPLERRCWLQFTADRTSVSLFAEPTPVTFSNLRDGFHVRTPFWVEFGIRGMGVIPAGNKREGSGHHHLLIDTPLPATVSEPIPFSEKYRHFGKGQTAATVDLPPGEHNLRLLFADYDHRPYYVFSRKINIRVLANRQGSAKPRIDPDRFSETCQAWYADEVSTPPTEGRRIYIKNIRDGETVDSPFLIKLGVIGLGVAPERTSIPETGHFALHLKRNRSLVTSVRLRDGQTETVLDLSPGEYDAELTFLAGDGQVLLRDQMKVIVASRAQSARK
jgi:hypothetical protein